MDESLELAFGDAAREARREGFVDAGWDPIRSIISCRFSETLGELVVVPDERPVLAEDLPDLSCGFAPPLFWVAGDFCDRLGKSFFPFAWDFLAFFFPATPVPGTTPAVSSTPRGMPRRM